LKYFSFFSFLFFFQNYLKNSEKGKKIFQKTRNFKKVCKKKRKKVPLTETPQKTDFLKMVPYQQKKKKFGAILKKGFRHFFCNHYIMTQNLKKMPKNADIFVCKFCDFKCSKKSNYDKHLSTRKHKMMTNDDAKSEKNALPKFMCICGKKYKHRQGLYIHKKKCVFIKENLEKISENFENFENFENSENSENFENCEKSENSEKLENYENYNDSSIDYKELFMKAMQKNDELVSQNSELVSKIVEIAPNIGNNNNNKFNINVFLNNNCKDALNLTDFVDSLQLKLKDLETTGKLGYVEGVSQIFKNGLSNLELTKRPIHCIKNDENIYVKDNDIWDKEHYGKIKIKKAIEDIGKNNFKQISNWIDENPDCTSSGTHKNSEYMQIIENSIIKNEQDVDKVIENIKSEVIIKDD
jgi:hypothetical protein